MKPKAESTGEDSLLGAAVESVLQHAWNGEKYEPARLTESDLKLLSAVLFKERT